MFTTDLSYIIYHSLLLSAPSTVTSNPITLEHWILYLCKLKVKLTEIWNYTCYQFVLSIYVWGHCNSDQSIRITVAVLYEQIAWGGYSKLVTQIGVTPNIFQSMRSSQGGIGHPNLSCPKLIFSYVWISLIFTVLFIFDTKPMLI